MGVVAGPQVPGIQSPLEDALAAYYAVNSPLGVEGVTGFNYDLVDRDGERATVEAAQARVSVGVAGLTAYLRMFYTEAAKLRPDQVLADWQRMPTGMKRDLEPIVDFIRIERAVAFENVSSRFHGRAPMLLTTASAPSTESELAKSLAASLVRMGVPAFVAGTESLTVADRPYRDGHGVFRSVRSARPNDKGAVFQIPVIAIRSGTPNAQRLVTGALSRANGIATFGSPSSSLPDTSYMRDSNGRRLSDTFTFPNAGYLQVYMLEPKGFASVQAADPSLRPLVAAVCADTYTGRKWRGKPMTSVVVPPQREFGVARHQPVLRFLHQGVIGPSAFASMSLAYTLWDHGARVADRPVDTAQKMLNALRDLSAGDELRMTFGDRNFALRACGPREFIAEHIRHERAMAAMQRSLDLMLPSALEIPYELA